MDDTKDIKFAIVTADGEVDEMTGSLQVKDVLDIVGGDFEQLPSHPDVSVYAKKGDALTDSDGFNWSATRLVQNYLMPTDRVFGTVIVTGKADAGGNPKDVSVATMQTLREWYEHRR